MAKYEIRDGVGIIPEGTTEIGYGSFQGCSELKSIIIPDTVTKIGNYAFEGCTALTSIAIPGSVTKIGYSIFRRCSGLTSIVVSEGNKVYDSRNGCDAVINTASNTLVLGCNATIIPDSVAVIGPGAFEDNIGLTSIVIPDSVTKIGNGAFYGCTGLTSITIPDSVTEIGINSFFECTGLTSIVIPESVTELGRCAFAYCKGLKSIVLHAKLKKLESTFSSCTSLETITLPAGIKEIDEYTFEGCDALKTIFVPAKKTDYYKNRLPDDLCELIVELPAEKKAKKTNTITCTSQGSMSVPKGTDYIVEYDKTTQDVTINGVEYVYKTSKKLTTQKFNEVLRRMCCEEISRTDDKKAHKLTIVLRGERNMKSFLGGFDIETWDLCR